MRKIISLLAALALALTLLAGCGSGQNSQPPAPDPAPVTDGTGSSNVPPASAPNSRPEETLAPEEAGAPADDKPAGEDEPRPSSDASAGIQPDDSAPAPDQPEPAEPAANPEPVPATEPAPAPEPEPEPENTVLEDGTYTANVTLEGGTGRAKVESPAQLRCEGGKFYAVIVWSSPNYDYMKVDGEKYLQTNTEGNSTFEIPVSAFDQKLDVIADTVAMSEPYEVEYTLTFDSASLQKQ